MKKLENKYLKIAHECAEASGKIIKKYFRKKVKIEIKNDNTPVTKADKEAEKKIRDIIKAAKNNNCSIRIGVNAGSLEREILEKYGEPVPEAAQKAL